MHKEHGVLEKDKIVSLTDVRMEQIGGLTGKRRMDSEELLSVLKMVSVSELQAIFKGYSSAEYNGCNVMHLHVQV